MPRMAIEIDTSTAFGARAARRLRDEGLAWLVTVSPAGQPLPSRVWFEWDGDSSVLLYSKPDTPKLRNIAANPRVALHLDGDDVGGDLVILHGTARVSDDPPADDVTSYVDKYEARMARNGWTPSDFAAMYSVPLRIDLTRLRGW
jgi:PPOX class probable F420-dependent enzyme